MAERQHKGINAVHQTPVPPCGKSFCCQSLEEQNTILLLLCQELAVGETKEK